MVELKTAVLYGASAATPAVLLGADDETVDALYKYGIDSGRALQIQDDVLDLTVPSDELGKQRGSDLVEGKETLITLHARQEGVDVDGLVDRVGEDLAVRLRVYHRERRQHDSGHTRRFFAPPLYGCH